MTTPTRDFLQRRRRSVRQALAVIPDMTGLTVSPGSPLPTEVNTLNNSRYSMDSWSPAPSPDEMVIQKRGRRRRTIVWSPECDAKRDSLLSMSLRDRTPVKSPSKAPTHLRNTPRKRLVLDDNNETDLVTPEKNKKVSTDQKLFNGNLANGLRGLSNDQLVKVIMDLISMQEDGALSVNDKLRDVIMKRMPIADIQPLRERLSLLRQNVYASLVSFDTSLDEPAYSRAYIHLDAFEKTLVQQGSRLIESQHWTSVMQYVFAAWVITKDLPEWQYQDNIPRKCFRSLAHFAKQALLKGNFSNSVLELFVRKMEIMSQDCEDMKICIQIATEMIRP